jgi:hypothetical protein
MREKLIELIYNFYLDYNGYICDGCGTQVAEQVCGTIADHLIANGVRLEEKQATSDQTSKWIPVTERLPEEKGDVLVCDTREDFVSTWEYLGNDLWLYDNIFWCTDDVTHWMPLPEPPKGE